MEVEVRPRAEARGAVPEVVLLHGWGLHGGVWDGLREALGARVRTMAPDLPGHGHARGAVADFTLDALAGQVAGLLAGPAVWVGWSLGALVALTAALQFPQAVVRLVLIGATPRFVQAHGWPHAMTVETLAQFTRALESDYRGTLLRFLSLQAGAGDAGRETVRRLRAVLAAGGEPAPAALRAGLRLLAETDLRAALPAIRTPALVVHGGRDRLAPPAAARHLASALPAARLHLIPAAGHAPFLSHPAEVGHALEAFLRA